MRTLIGIIFVSFTITQAQIHESFHVPDLGKVLWSANYSGIGNIGSTCKEHLEELGKGIKNQSSWALYMIDSTAKIPEGILVGHFSIPGVFDECVNAVSERFSGKHCMASLGLNKPDNIALPNNDYLLSTKSSEDMKLTFRFGICIPSTCNSTDMINVFLTATESYDFLKIVKFNLTEHDCSTKEFRPFRTEDWITVVVIGVIVVIALSSTVYELIVRFINREKTPNPLWSSFSIYNNGKRLFTISQSAAQMKALNGIRFLSMCWVILGHSYFSIILGAPLNLLDSFKLVDDKSFTPVSNGFLAVDSFFFLSGLLVCIVFFRDISKKKSFDVPVAFIHRYMRLTPPFALLMLIQSTVLSRMGNGPFWNEHVDATEKQCRESWWTGLLYLQNYLKPTSMCLGQAWYLSADMQMFWVSPLVLYPLLWFPSFAPFFLAILVLAAAFTNFAIAYVNKLAPNFLFNMKSFSIDQFELEYAPFHTRMAPWLIGLATGYIICGIQAKKIKLNLSKMWVLVGWMASFCLLGGSLFGIIRFMTEEPDSFTQLEASMYLAFHRVGWALGMGWVVVACVAGYGGPINSLLSIDSFQPLAKLSYCNFLVHMTLQGYRANSSRQNLYMRHFDVVYGYFADLLISHLISIPVVLLFEFPFTNLDRHFLQKLVIFPWPRPQKEAESVEKEQKEEKLEVPKEPSEDVEKGKVNPVFNET